MLQSTCYIALPPIANAKPQAKCHILEHHSADQEAHASLLILMCTVKFLSYALAGHPVWVLETFDKIFQGDMDILVPEPEELTFLLELVFPLADC